MQSKKLLILVGSHAGSSSHTLALSKSLADQVANACRVSVEVEALTADQWHIEPCISCSSCFRIGCCPGDEKDQMALLRQKIMSCDALIIASPVYVLHVSSAMKLLVDRLALWTHTMPLLGKPCCVVVTTSRSVGETARYLESVFSYMGCSVLTPLLINYRDIVPKDAPDLEQVRMSLTERLSQLLDGLEQPAVTEAMRIQYGRQSRMYRRVGKFLDAYPDYADYMREFALWKAQGYLPYDMVEEALSMMHTTDT